MRNDRAHVRRSEEEKGRCSAQNGTDQAKAECNACSQDDVGNNHPAHASVRFRLHRLSVHRLRLGLPDHRGLICQGVPVVSAPSLWAHDGAPRVCRRVRWLLRHSRGALQTSVLGRCGRANVAHFRKLSASTASCWRRQPRHSTAAAATEDCQHRRYTSDRLCHELVERELVTLSRAFQRPARAFPSHSPPWSSRFPSWRNGRRPAAR